MSGHLAACRTEPMSRYVPWRRTGRPPRSYGLLSVALVASLAVIATGCSSSDSNPTPTTTSSAAVIPTTSAPTSSAPTSGASGADLSGTWTGNYSGAFTGTFTLTWQQTGSKLSGTIDLSTDGSPQIDGSVTGDTITFGTVGSTAITYTGTVSGNSMSGTYTVGSAGGGSWSAKKS